MKKYKPRLRKIHRLGLTPIEILHIVLKTNLKIAAKILGVSDVGLRKYLIRENLYNSAHTIKVGRANRRQTLNAYTKGTVE